MRETFRHKNFHRKTLKMIEQANVIINELGEQGYVLTIRQLYYQFVSRGLLANKQQNYANLASVIDDARKAGLVDWDAIEDRTRYLRQIPAYDDPESFLDSAVQRYYEPVWAHQPAYCEVWIEKDALLGVIEPICHRWRVPYFACRGYASSSELYSAGKRLARKRKLGYQCHVFHLGDHDPSGLDMTRVNDETVMMFGRSMDVKFDRLALNMEQVKHYNPPPNPAKESDSRFAGYLDAHGDESWELDALNPSVIAGLVNGAIESVVDRSRFDEAIQNEAENENTLRTVANRWSDVLEFFNPDYSA